MLEHEIGKNLRELRGSKTQEEVADDLKMSRSALGMYEQGRRVPRDEIKVKIAEYYGTTVDSIFFDHMYTKRKQTPADTEEEERLCSHRK